MKRKFKAIVFAMLIPLLLSITGIYTYAEGINENKVQCFEEIKNEYSKSDKVNKQIKDADLKVEKTHEEIKNSDLKEEAPEETKDEHSELEEAHEQIKGDELQAKKLYEEKLKDERYNEELKNTRAIIPMDRNPIDNGYGDNVEISKKAYNVKGDRTFEIKLEVKGISPKAKPVDAVLVMDRSGSMARGKPSSMEYAKQAAKNFTNEVLKNNNNSRVSIVSFSGPKSFLLPLGSDDNAKTEIELSNDLNKINKAIDQIEPCGGTNIQSGFHKATNILNNNGRDNANKVIVLLTDGVANVSNGAPILLNNPIIYDWNMKAAYNAGIEAQEKGYLVFTVGLLNGIYNKVTRKLAEETLREAAQPGNYFDSPKPENLIKVYNNISKLVSYAGTNAVVEDVISEDIIKNFDILEYENGQKFKVNQGDTSYDEKLNKITWNIGTIGDYRNVEPLTMTYRIKAKENYKGSNKEEIPTNKWAKINYKNVKGENKSEKFQVPTIVVPKPLKADAGKDREIGYGSFTTLGGNPTAKGGYGTNFKGNVDGKEYVGFYKYKWEERSIKDKEWKEFSNESNPKVNPSEDTEYKVTVTDYWGAERENKVRVKVKKGTIVIKQIVLDERGKEISKLNKEFEITISGPNQHTWTHFSKANKDAKFKGLKMGNYDIKQSYSGMEYELVSITDNGKINLSLKESKKEIIIKTKKINKGWFKGEDFQDNYFIVGEDQQENKEEKSQEQNGESISQNSKINKLNIYLNLNKLEYKGEF